MRRTSFLSVALLLTFAGCNNAGDKTAASTDSPKQTTAHDTMNMGNTGTTPVPALPDVPTGAKVYFKNLKNGDKVKSPFKVEMGVEGIKLDTSGPVVAGSGHHHLLVDAEDSIPAGTPVPKNATHLHFGKAQSSTELTLPAGTHKLTLQYADGIHRSYGSKLTATIKVTVQ